MTKVIIASAVRTPIGRFGGALSQFDAVTLGTIAAKAAIAKANLDPAVIDQAIFGHVLSANNGQNVARQVALAAGMSEASTAMTINQVCGSGLKAVRLGQSAILLGDADVVLVGGTEVMSQVPFYAPNMRFGHKLGNASMVDGLLQDGLNDAQSGQHMGITAETVATRFKVSRQDQDAFALASHEKALAAQQAGAFDEEIVPVTVTVKGQSRLITQDEGPRADTNLERLAKLRPVFAPDGSVTAGNASPLNDGAAALVLMSEEKAKALGVTPLAVIDAYAEVGIDPSIMGYAPKLAVDALMQKTGGKLADVDLVELNEAFASQSLAVIRDLQLAPERVNIKGGAIALGHPLGASGARILTTLIHSLKAGQNGIATLCVGGGMGVAMQVKRVNDEIL